MYRILQCACCAISKIPAPLSDRCNIISLSAKKLMGTFKHPSCAVILTTGAGFAIKIYQLYQTHSRHLFLQRVLPYTFGPGVDAISTGC